MSLESASRFITSDYNLVMEGLVSFSLKDHYSYLVTATSHNQSFFRESISVSLKNIWRRIRSYHGEEERYHLFMKRRKKICFMCCIGGGKDGFAHKLSVERDLLAARLSGSREAILFLILL